MEECNGLSMKFCIQPQYLSCVVKITQNILLQVGYCQAWAEDVKVGF